MSEAVRSMQTGEVRITSETGGQKGKKPEQVHHLDPLALLYLGKVAAFGGEKYEDYNYLKGYDWSLSFDAGQRHLMQHWAGIDLDSESGLYHVAHAAWHSLTLLSFMLRHIGKDDRPKHFKLPPSMEEADLAAMVDATAEPEGLPLEVIDGAGDTWLRAPAGDSYALAGDNSRGDRLAAVERAERRLESKQVCNTYQHLADMVGPLTIVRGDAA